MNNPVVLQKILPDKIPLFVKNFRQKNITARPARRIVTSSLRTRYAFVVRLSLSHPLAYVIFTMPHWRIRQGQGEHGSSFDIYRRNSNR